MVVVVLVDELLVRKWKRKKEKKEITGVERKNKKLPGAPAGAGGTRKGKEGLARLSQRVVLFTLYIYVLFFFSLLRSRSACRLRERMELRFKRHQR